VDEGDTLELVSRLSTIVAAPVRASAQIRSTRRTPRSAFQAAPSRALSTVDVHGRRRILGSLNAEQRRAAEAVRGPSASSPAPGSGKTTTITHRIANQVATARSRRRRSSP
jgi:hypothetical protein